MQAFPLWASFFFFFFLAVPSQVYEDGRGAMLSGKRSRDDGKALKPRVRIRDLLPCTPVKSDQESTLVGPHSSSCLPLEHPEAMERQDPRQAP